MSQTSTAKGTRLDLRIERPGLLAFYLVLSYATLGIGGWLTSLGMGPWYDTLPKPLWQPPGWVFGPVWTVLMTLLAVATWQLTVKAKTGLKVPLTLYGIQLLLNMGWSLAFFTLHSPWAALVVIVPLDVVLALMIVYYRRSSNLAALLLVPYLLWLLLATSINIWICLHI